MAIQRPVRTATSVSSSLARAKRAGLDGLADERPDHPDAGDLLAQDPVHPVDAGLHQPEAGDHPGDDEADRQEQHRDADREQPGQPEVLAHRHQHAADHHDRRRDHHRAGHQHQHLHLLDVVGVAGDQRRRPELVRPRGCENVPTRWKSAGAQVAAERHRGPRPEVHRADRCSRICTSETISIIAPVRDDVAGVAAGDAVVDDVGVQAGQVQRGHGADELQQHDERERPAVGREVLLQDPDQHVRPPGRWVGCGCHRAGRR